jgi:hypothetical protein
LIFHDFRYIVQYKSSGGIAMRTITTVFAVLMIILSAACGKDRGEPAAADPAPRQELEVVFLSGSAEAATSTGTAARAVRVGMRFGEGAVLQTLTADSRLDLRLASGSTLRLSGNSKLALAELYRDGKLDVEKTGLELLSGSILVKARLLVGDSRLQVRTQTAVAGVRGTSFLVRYDSAGGTSVAVQSGRVAVSPATTMPASLADKAEGFADRLQDAGAVEVGPGRQVTVSQADAAAHSQRIAEAVAAAGGDQERIALDAARHTAIQPVAAPAETIREIGTFSAPETTAPETGPAAPRSGAAGAAGTGQARPVETKPATGGLPEDIGIKE